MTSQARATWAAIKLRPTKKQLRLPAQLEKEEGEAEAEEVEVAEKRNLNFRLKFFLT